MVCYSNYRVVYCKGFFAHTPGVLQKGAGLSYWHRISRNVVDLQLLLWSGSVMGSFLDNTP